MDVDNIKPKGLVAVAAVAMLLLGKPLSGSRGFGGLQFTLPKTGTCTAKVRTHATKCPCSELVASLDVRQMISIW